MKNTLLLKIVGVLIALSALADTQLELLKALGLSEGMVNGLKLLGLVIALLLPSVAQKQAIIGGSTPPPDKDEK